MGQALQALQIQFDPATQITVTEDIMPTLLKLLGFLLAVCRHACTPDQATDLILVLGFVFG
jgi:hypothetical protein